MGCGRPCLGHGFSFHMILMSPKAGEPGILRHEQSIDVIQKAESVNGKKGTCLDDKQTFYDAKWLLSNIPKLSSLDIIQSTWRRYTYTAA